MKKSTVLVMDGNMMRHVIPLVLSAFALIPITSIFMTGGSLPLNRTTGGFILILFPIGMAVYSAYNIFAKQKPDPEEDYGSRVTAKSIDAKTRFAMLKMLAYNVNRNDIARYFRVNPNFVGALPRKHPELVIALNEPERASLEAHGRAGNRKPTVQASVNMMLVILNQNFLLNKEQFSAVFGEMATTAYQCNEDVFPKIVSHEVAVLNASVEPADERARRIQGSVPSMIQTHTSEVRQLPRQNVQVQTADEVHTESSQDEQVTRDTDGLVLLLLAAGMKQRHVAETLDISPSMVSRILNSADMLEQYPKTTVRAMQRAQRNVGRRNSGYSQEMTDEFERIIKGTNYAVHSA